MHTGSWRKSSRSGDNNSSNCVEARRAEATFQVRDSKLGDESPIFELAPSEFESLLGAAR